MSVTADGLAKLPAFLIGSLTHGMSRSVAQLLARPVPAAVWGLGWTICRLRKSHEYVMGANVIKRSE